MQTEHNGSFDDVMKILYAEEGINEQDIGRFSERELDKFFSLPIWLEIEKLLIVQRALIRNNLESLNSTQQVDYVCKGFLRMNTYLLQIRNVLIDENEENE